MSRLVAFGCSLTYGHGLPDCISGDRNPGPTSSKYAWPEIIAKKLGKKCTNMSSPGASNKKIWHDIINFKFEQSDTVFILWSYEERWSLLKSISDVEDFGHWIDSPNSVFYYKNMYNRYESRLQTKLYVSHANFFLKEKNIKTYNLTPTHDSQGIFKISGSNVPHIPLYIGDNYRKSYPLADDNLHPGLECHEAFANDVLEYVSTLHEVG